jgi:hypothetical protein
MSSLEDFIARVAQAATAVGLSLVRCKDLESREFRGGRGQETLQASLLPDEVFGGLLGGVPVLFSSLPDSHDEDLVEDAVKRLRNQSVIARSFLRPEQVVDLQVWMSGPTASSDSPVWRSLAVVIERDERVARKLVWLRPGEGGGLADSFSSFIARTFLARPWIAAQHPSHAQLDRLSVFLSVVSDVAYGGDVVKRWFDLAEAVDDVEGGAELVEKLIQAWKESRP